MNFLNRLFRRPPGGLTCQQVEAVMQQYLDNELDPDMVPKVLEHLEACRDCGLEAELYSRIQSSLREHQEAPSDDSMTKIRALAQELATNGLPPEDSETADA